MFLLKIVLDLKFFFNTILMERFPKKIQYGAQKFPQNGKKYNYYHIVCMSASVHMSA